MLARGFVQVLHFGPLVNLILTPPGLLDYFHYREPLRRPQEGPRTPFEKLCAGISTLEIKHAPLQMGESKGVARNDAEVHETRKASSRLALIAAKVKGYSMLID